MLRKALHAGIIGLLINGMIGSVPALSGQEQDNPYTTGQDIQSGEQLFGRNCSRCHGLEAGGGERGPDLRTGGFQHSSTDAGLFAVIADGIPNTEMVGIGRSRSEQSVWQLVAYLRSLNSEVRVEVAGNPSIGEELYGGKGDCSSCHMIDGEGGRHGPDLSAIGDRRSPDQLLSDLLTPSERVQQRWWTMRVMHQDGTEVEGLRMNEGTYSVRILDAEDNLWSFLKRDLRQSERTETSSMPAYGESFTSGELEDLVAYLYGLSRGIR
ncbi:uncharacterized protein METZ01_LOCUS117080 [marine metagenome]|jgi:putative heme-binding domain-containing protein|uniref:Cytochrome c domain-containing protein n=1 Tax=marine metagenome TaxID=408172 RepID=A0A381XHK0_9ZZZZ|nr:c-type cytochrome [Gemmatimonadota bacterium]|tara:strand:- start:141 stop:941 length:801 start_codon:yes stop_codon:yes gene_type:complete